MNDKDSQELRNSNNPLITVVVITHNQSHTVVETLDSIYGQTYPLIELIVSDDCSTDKTRIIVTEWIESHNGRFQNAYLTKMEVNSGVTKNCNHGISLAKGEYVQLIAGDDIFFPTLLEDKLKFAKENNINYVVSKTEPFGDNQELVKRMISFCERGYRIIQEGFDSQRNNILYDNYIAGPSGGFYKMEFFRQFGGYDERYPMCEDYPFIYHYIMAGNEIKLLDKVLTRYRITGSSLCTSRNSPMTKSQFDFFFKERLWQLIKKRKWKYAIHSTCTLLYKKCMSYDCHKKIKGK